MAVPAPPPDLHRLSLGRESFAARCPLALLGSASYPISCPSTRRFASRFFQPSPHGRGLAVRLGSLRPTPRGTCTPKSPSMLGTQRKGTVALCNGPPVVSRRQRGPPRMPCRRPESGAWIAYVNPPLPMRAEGFEPPWTFAQMPAKHPRLPVPPRSPPSSGGGFDSPYDQAPLPTRGQTRDALVGAQANTEVRILLGF